MPDTARPEADALSAFASFAADTAATAIPHATLAKTALILADTVGAIAGGAAEEDVRALTARQQGGGDALVIGTAETRPPGIAALLNGTAGTTLEMDEGHQFSKGHPGIHTIPAALASCTRDITGAELLAAIALGYDAGARVGIGAALRSSMHPHGTWGVLCAATASARLQGVDAARMRHALSLSASLSLATSRRTMLEGGTVRNVYAGVSGQLGVLAADMVASGFTGDRDGVAQVYGHVISDEFDRSALTADLGERWEVDRNYFKMHSCCRYNHAALDALARLTEAGPVRPEEVTRIDVATYGLATELDDPAPVNVLAAKFSVPFALATALVTGSTGVSSFTTDQVRRPETRALAARVHLTEDQSMSALLPEKRPARVTITLADGRTRTGATETNRGDWADPYGPEEIHAKFLSLATRVWPEPAAEEVWDLCMALPEAPTTAPLFEALARAAA